MSDTKIILQKLVDALCIGLIANPKELIISVNELDGQSNMIIEISCADSDFPKVLGSAKANLLAIEEVVSHAGKQMGCNLKVCLASPESDERKHVQHKFKANKDWQPEPMLEDLNMACACVVDGNTSIKVVHLKTQTTFVVQTATDKQIDDKLADALRRIFHAQGRNQGRSVDVIFS